MSFDGFDVGNIKIVYVTDFVLTYCLSYTRYSTIDPYDKKTARTTRVAVKHDTLNELVRLPCYAPHLKPCRTKIKR